MMVGAEEVLDVPQVFLDAEQQVAGPLAFEEHAVGWHALLKLLDVMPELIEELMLHLGVPVVEGSWAAEGGKEVLEDAEGGSSSLL